MNIRWLVEVSNFIIYNCVMMLIVILGILFIPTVLFLVIEYIVERLPEGHGLVNWWRTHIIDRTDDDLF